MTNQSQQWKALSERAAPLPYSFDHDWQRTPAIFSADGKLVLIVEKLNRQPREMNEGTADLVEFAVNNFTQLLKERDEAVARAGAVSMAERDVLAERRRQIDALGWTPEHDDHHDKDLALPRAAACYALSGTGANGPFWINHLQVPQQVWPYRWEWKPKDRRTNLVRAAALLLAEIERLDRATLSRTQEKGEEG